MDLVISPLNGLETIRAEDEDAFAARFFAFAKEKSRLVHAVDRSVLRHHGAGNARERRKQIDAMHDSIADAARGHLGGPADHERNANAAFQRGEVLPAPRSGPTIPGTDVFRPVVAREYDEGVVADSKVVHGVEHLSDVV